MLQEIIAKFNKLSLTEKVALGVAILILFSPYLAMFGSVIIIGFFLYKMFGK